MSKSTRAGVFLLLVAAVGLFLWNAYAQPKDTELRFVLTDIELAQGVQILRHEHITRLDCKILDQHGSVVTTLSHLTPGAVSHPTELRLPAAKYQLHISLAFKLPDGKTRTVPYLQERYLDGGKVAVRP